MRKQSVTEVKKIIVVFFIGFLSYAVSGGYGFIIDYTSLKSNKFYATMIFVLLQLIWKVLPLSTIFYYNNLAGKEVIEHLRT